MPGGPYFGGTASLGPGSSWKSPQPWDLGGEAPHDALGASSSSTLGAG